MAKRTSARNGEGAPGLTDGAFARGLTILGEAPDPAPSGVAGGSARSVVPPSEMLSLGYMAEANGGSRLEDVPGFDAYRARNSGLFPLSSLPAVPAPGAGGYTLQNVIGADNLVPVPDTTGLPWRGIALLSITYDGGVRATGTAWFLGERTLGTAGHNIRHPVYGPANEIMVSPAYDGSIAPFGTFRAVQTYCDARWLAGDADAAFDFGALKIADATVGRRLGWFGFAAYDNRQLHKLLLNVSGYPVDRAPRTQYYNGGRLEGTDDRFLRYAFDTVGGMSGAPIFARFDQQRVVVGIHTGGNERTNRARRIDAEVYAALDRFNSLP